MKNKVVGILTLQNSNNFGAMYQVYALSKYLEDRGCNVFVLNYEMTRDKACLIDYIKHPVAFLQKIIIKRKMIFKRFFLEKSSNAAMSRNEKYVDIFDEFRNNNLKITSECYNFNRLLDEPPEADVYICGSDQVWAADFLFTSSAFLLGFVPENRKKISYAASFGKDKLEPYLKKIFKINATKLTAVSVREKSAVDIVKSIANIDAVHVVDPTLLLNKEDYDEIVDYSLVPNVPYILVYKLDQDASLSDWSEKFINKISSSKQLAILSVSTNLSRPFDKGWKELYPTPGQLLGLMEKSSINITNSFHGTVFSIIFRKKFLTFSRDVYRNKQNTRMMELLSELDLINFYCPPFLDEKDILKKIELEYNYTNVFYRLSILKNCSIKFIDNSILL